MQLTANPTEVEWKSPVPNIDAQDYLKNISSMFPCIGFKQVSWNGTDDDGDDSEEKQNDFKKANDNNNLKRLLHYGNMSVFSQA